MLYQKVKVSGEDIFIPVNMKEFYVKCEMCGDMVEADLQEIVTSCCGLIPVNYSIPCCGKCTAKMRKIGFKPVYCGMDDEEPDEVYDDET